MCVCTNIFLNSRIKKVFVLRLLPTDTTRAKKWTYVILSSEKLRNNDNTKSFSKENCKNQDHEGLILGQR